MDGKESTSKVRLKLSLCWAFSEVDEMSWHQNRSRREWPQCYWDGKDRPKGSRGEHSLSA